MPCKPAGLSCRDENGNLEFFRKNYTDYNIVDELSKNRIEATVRDMSFTADINYNITSSFSLSGKVPPGITYPNWIEKYTKIPMKPKLTGLEPDRTIPAWSKKTMACYSRSRAIIRGSNTVSCRKGAFTKPIVTRCSIIT